MAKHTDDACHAQGDERSGSSTAIIILAGGASMRREGPSNY